MRCGTEPAHTWTVTGPEGAVREVERLVDHGEGSPALLGLSVGS
jgi:hypothetical protein